MRTSLYPALSLLLSVCCLTACGGQNKEETPKDEITLSATSVRLDADGTPVSVQVSSTHEWGASASESWLRIDPPSSVDRTVTVSVSATGNTVSEERTGTVSFRAGTASATIEVSQAPGPEKPEEPYYRPEGYSLVWHDEFEEGTMPGSDWTHESKKSGWVNNELQNYVSNTSPNGIPVTELKDGKLRIRCFKEDGKIYSGRIYAKMKTGWTYGYIEASIKLPKGKGTWPAFWMMPVNFTSWPDDGEIDIMEEVGTNPNYVSSSLHAKSHVHSNGTQVTHEMYCAGAEDEFHTYAMEWTAKNITTYVDGKVQLSYDNRGLGRDDWPYDDPFYVILNLAWGGDWGGMNGVDESALPAVMEVDYVRVFQKD